MIRIALCDDEKNMLDELSDYIKAYAETRGDRHFEVFRFETARSLVGALGEGNAFDIFVLDVYIGDEMGTKLALDIRKSGIDSPIIFATTSIEHAPESFETGTLRYLVKPIKKEKLYEALDAALERVRLIEERFLKFKTECGIVSVNASHISHSEAHDHYQFIHQTDGDVLKVRLTVSELFSTLGKYGGFVRVGSAYIVNLRYVKNVTPTNVCLYSNINIQIPRGKFTEIKNTFWNFQCEGQED